MAVPILGRRRFLAGGLAAAGGIVAPGGPTLAVPVRTLSFANLHTGERLTTPYWADGRHLPAGCRSIDRVLRDHRTGEISPISTLLLDFLYALRGRLETEAAFEVISGYRSPKTNASLANASAGVAQRSLHVQGMAIDIRIGGYPLKRLREAALALKGGGVGYYPNSGFVHVDVGRVRYW